MTPDPADARIITRRQLVDALQSEMPESLRDLQPGNIAPVDLAEAAIGSGVAVFTRYAKVLDRDGSVMSDSTARALTVRILCEVLTEQMGELDLDPDTRRAIAAYDVSGLKDAELGSEVLTSVLRRIAEDALLDRLLSWRARPWGTPWAGHDEIVTAADAVTEIGLSRSACYGTCPVYTVRLRREGPAEFIGEYFVDLVGPHEAELEPGSFDDLARAVMFLGRGPIARDVAFRQLRRQMEAALDWLTGLERRVLQLRFGLEDGHPRTLDEVSHEFNVTSERIRQIEARALRNVRPGVVLDASTTTVWVLRRRRRIAIEPATMHRIATLIDAAATDLAWHGLDGARADASGLPPMQMAQGEHRHWTQRRYKGSDNLGLAAQLDSPAVRDALTSRERRVLQLRWGLEDGRTWTFAEIGMELNEPPERIDQIEAHAQRRMLHVSVAARPAQEVSPTAEGSVDPCPECGMTDGGVLVSKRGRIGPFVGCNRYPACDYIKKDGPRARLGSDD